MGLIFVAQPLSTFLSSTTGHFRQAILWVAFFFGLMGSIQATGADSPEFPTRPIKIIVNMGPGGLIDLTARTFVNVAKKNGHTSATFVVENKPGAGGLTAIEKLLHAPVDGHTLLACTKSNISKIVSSGKESFSEQIDWLALLMKDPECIITRANSPYSDWNAVVRDGRMKQGGQIWAGPDPGGLDHVMGMKTWKAFEFSARWIPFGSGSDAKRALLGYPEVVAYVGNPRDVKGNEDNLKIAVISSPKRIEAYSDVPTFSEFGVEGLDKEFMWRGFAMRKGTPQIALDWYDQLFESVTQDAEWRAIWEKGGIQVEYVKGAEFDAIIEQDRIDFRGYLAGIGLAGRELSKTDATLNSTNGLAILGLAILLINALPRASRRTREKFQRNTGLGVPLSLIACCSVLFLVSRSFPQGDVIGPAAVPRLWMSLLIPLSGLLVLQEKTSTSVGRTEPSGVSLVRTIAALLALYLISIGWLGYFPSTFIFLPLSMYLLGVRNQRAIWTVTVGWLLLSFLLFVKLLGLPLPSGLLFVG